MGERPGLTEMPKAKTKKVKRRIQPPVLSEGQRAFAVEYSRVGKVDTAAKAVGIDRKMGYRMLAKPHVLQFIEQLNEKKSQEIAKAEAKREVLTIEMIEDNLANVIEHGGGHERRGEADRVAALHLAMKYRRMLPETNKQTGVWANIVNQPQLPPPIYQSGKIQQARQQQLEAGSAANSGSVTSASVALEAGNRSPA
jgi:uncharacterized protein YlxP (DUF503 family)